MLARLILDGVLGPLRIGLSKRELVALAGPPPTWEGKPGSLFDRGIIDCDNSDTWIYSGVHVEIKEGVIERLAIYMDYHLLDWKHEWFRSWPLSFHPKLSEVRDYLDGQEIPYEIYGNSLGSDIIMHKAYVFGVAFGAAMPHRELKDVDVFGMTRVRDHTDLPMGYDASHIMGLLPRRSIDGDPK